MNNSNNLDNNISNQKNSYSNANNSFDKNSNNNKSQNRLDIIYKKDNFDNNKSYSSYPAQIEQNYNNKIPQKSNKSNKINSIPLPKTNKNQNKMLPQYNDINNNKNEEKIRKNLINDPILITDSNGNPIYIEGQKLVGMEIVPIIRKDGKEELDENGNIVFLGPDGEKKNSR